MYVQVYGACARKDRRICNPPIRHPESQRRVSLYHFPSYPTARFCRDHRHGAPQIKLVYGTSGCTHSFSHDGFQAEYATLPLGAVTEKPAGLSFAQAATVGVPYTDLLLQATQAKKGETILILGAAGAVGQAAVTLAVYRGFQVFRGVRGCYGVFDTQADPSLNAVSEDLTHGKGVDIVLDTVGQIALATAAIAKLAPFGRYATIAAPRDSSAALEIDLLDLHRKNKSIVGCNSISWSIEDLAARLREIGPVFESQQFRDTLNRESWNAVSAYETAGTDKEKKFVLVLE